jgi:curved DNA-binding protein CbpA
MSSTRLPTPNDYKLLGVNEDTAPAGIKNAFNKLALQFHPDRHMKKSKEEQQEMGYKFGKIKEAYDAVLATAIQQKENPQASQSSNASIHAAFNVASNDSHYSDTSGENKYYEGFADISEMMKSDLQELINDLIRAFKNHDTSDLYRKMCMEYENSKSNFMPIDQSFGLIPIELAAQLIKKLDLSGNDVNITKSNYRNKEYTNVQYVGFAILDTAAFYSTMSLSDLRTIVAQTQTELKKIISVAKKQQQVQQATLSLLQQLHEKGGQWEEKPGKLLVSPTYKNLDEAKADRTQMAQKFEKAGISVDSKLLRIGESSQKDPSTQLPLCRIVIDAQLITNNLDKLKNYVEQESKEKNSSPIKPKIA